jgi:hypothetical protein
VKKPYEINNCRFRFGGPKLIGIKFNVMKNMVVNCEFKQPGEIIENINGSVVAQTAMITAFKYGYTSCFLPYNGEVLPSQDQVIYKPKNLLTYLRTELSPA